MWAKSTGEIALELKTYCFAFSPRSMVETGEKLI